MPAPVTEGELPRVDDDVRLLARVAESDLDALGILYDRHEAAVRRLIRRLGVSAGDVDDLVQSTFLDVLKSANKFVPTKSARTWVLGVSVMIVRRHRRSARRWFENLTGGIFERRRAPPSTPVEMFEQREDHRRFEQALADLSPKRREVFVLVVMEEMSGEAVATLLGIPVATVWTRLHHARKALRASLVEPGEPGEPKEVP